MITEEQIQEEISEGATQLECHVNQILGFRR